MPAMVFPFTSELGALDIVGAASAANKTSQYSRLKPLPHNTNIYHQENIAGMARSYHNGDIS